MQLFLGDCLDVLRTLPDASVDSLVTDPPAGIGFMGKEWDHHKGGRSEWVAWLTEVMKEAMRVMKPGAHGLVWAIPRTSHWTAMALEDAGFEVRDCVTHLFGSGFPKSMDISKAIDKAAGVARPSTPLVRCDGKKQHNKEGGGWKQSSAKYVHHPLFEGSNEDAKKWEGWGTALKPAAEFWWLVRKPCSEKTVAANVLKHGTGALNIDVSRIETTDTLTGSGSAPLKMAGLNTRPFHADAIAKGCNQSPLGRFPSNLLLSHSEHCTDLACCMFTCPVAELDRQSGQLKSGARKRDHKNNSTLTMNGLGGGESAASQGAASRFFYCAKISSSERNAGLDALPVKRRASANHGKVAEQHEVDDVSSRFLPNPSANTHPTVKPKKLMAYLIRLITPPGGTVLDPFAGSGSTGLAAKEEGFGFIGIEKEEEYYNIAQARVAAAKEKA